MTRPVYEAAQALIYDPDTANRSHTRASLEALGFRDVAVAASPENLRARIHEATPDLLMCEISGAEAAGCGLIQEVRQDRLGRNPFMVIMAMSWRRDGTVVSQVLNSGADDLVCRPISTPQLDERIKLQVERRKSFVVTADYIGPDRRRDPRRSGSECMPVPNSLKVKTLPGQRLDVAMRQIVGEVEEARQTVNVEKMRRNAFQLCVQWRLLEQRRPGGQEFAEALVRMSALTDDIKRRAARSPNLTALQWCNAMTESLASIRNMVDVSRLENEDSLVDFGPPMHLLGHAALSLGKILAPAELHPAHLVELDALVARIAPPVLRAQDGATVTFAAAS
jgi:DNA-binding response OmpR family regulator